MKYLAIVTISSLLSMGAARASGESAPAASDTGQPLQVQQPPVACGSAKQMLGVKGGSQILLQLQLQDLLNRIGAAARDEIASRLDAAGIAYSDLHTDKDSVEFRITTPADIEKAKAALEPLSRFDSTAPAPDRILTEPTSGVLRLAPTDAGVSRFMASTMRRAVNVVQRRLTSQSSGSNPVSIEQPDPDRILVLAPGDMNTNGLAMLASTTGNLTFRWVLGPAPAGGKAPEGATIMESADSPLEPILIENKAIVSGANLADAQTAFDPAGQPVVNFRFDKAGQELFAKATSQNIGKTLAIVFDGAVLSTPIIWDAIIGDTAQISGSFTTESANQMAALLRAGELPVALDVIEARTLGPSLAKALEAAKAGCK